MKKESKLQTLLTEYEAARDAIVPLRKQFETFRTEIRNAIDRANILRVRESDEFKDLANALRVFEPGTTARLRIDNIVERLTPVRAQMKEALDRFTQAELALRADLEPAWAEYTSNVRQKERDLIKAASAAIRPFCESDHRAHALAEETDQVKMATATAASLATVVHPDMQARRILSQAA